MTRKPRHLQGPGRRVWATVLACAAAAACGQPPEAIEISHLAMMAAETREAVVCGRLVEFEAQVVEASDVSSNSPAYYYVEDPEDDRARVIVVAAKLPVAGRRLSVTGRVSCESPFPVSGITYYVEEIERRDD